MGTGAVVAVAIWAAELPQAQVGFWPRAGEFAGLAMFALGVLVAVAIVRGWWLPGGFRDGPSVPSPEREPSQPPFEDPPPPSRPIRLRTGPRVLPFQGTLAVMRRPHLSHE
jgi:hypothetical protein